MSAFPHNYLYQEKSIMSKSSNPEIPIYYTYAYLDPRKSGNFIYQRGIDEIYCFNYELIYIGKTNSKYRIDDHINLALNSKKNKLFYNVIRKIYEAGLEPIRIKILQNVTEEEAFAEEINLISIAGRRDQGKGPLCNETDGGEGVSGCNAKDLIGQKFNRLTVIKNIIRNNRSHSLCRCDCGNEKIIRNDSLKRNHIKSCGCLQKELLNERNTLHGMYSTKIYRVWQQMIQNCTNPRNKHYKNCGAKGITVCERWQNFQSFLEDIGSKPSLKHVFARINTNENYFPSNCMWMTRREVNNKNFS